MKDVKVQDAVKNNWVDLYAPMYLRPYFRLSRFDRPAGAWLLFLPCVISALIAGYQSTFLHILHFIIVCVGGAWLMRGAGCTWNDIVDRDIDAKVARTRSRPLPSKAVSVAQAVVWMCIQALIALLLLLTLNLFTIWMALSSIFIVCLYPFAKRFTNWPQIVLGFTINWGVLLAWVELVGKVNLSGAMLYIALIFWTLYYDTIYAFMDIDDDQLSGVKSSAQAISKNAKPTLGFMLLGMSVFGGLSIYFAEIPSFLLVLASFLFFCVRLELQRQKFQRDNKPLLLSQFRQNARFGLEFVGLLTIIYIMTSML